MQNSKSEKGFTLIELLATITIMAVLIVAALPYVADYSSWARTTSERRDAQVVADAMSRWIATGGPVGATVVGFSTDTNYHNWYGARFSDGSVYHGWNTSSSCASSGIILDLMYGWTIAPHNTPQCQKEPYLSPNSSFTFIGSRIKIAFTSKKNWTVCPRSE